MANKSISAMKNIQEVCAILRKKYYGKNARSLDYKDSFIINTAVQNFPIEDRQALMDESITEEDNSDIKVTKSVNFRSDCLEKLQTISTMLGVPEAEVLRRILYYSLKSENKEVPQKKLQLSSLKSKVALLNTQIEICMKTLSDIENEIELLEAKEDKKEAK